MQISEELRQSVIRSLPEGERDWRRHAAESGYRCVGLRPWKEFIQIH